MEFGSNQAIYIQIVDYVCENILNGTLKSGDKITAIRPMAVKLEVNPNTVTRTYGLLQEEGIIDNQRGIGYFTNANATELIKIKKKEEFIVHDVPLFLKTMEKLDLSIENIISIFETMNNKKE